MFRAEVCAVPGGYSVKLYALFSLWARASASTPDAAMRDAVKIADKKLEAEYATMRAGAEKRIKKGKKK